MLKFYHSKQTGTDTIFSHDLLLRLGIRPHLIKTIIVNDKGITKKQVLDMLYDYDLQFDTIKTDYFEREEWAVIYHTSKKLNPTNENKNTISEPDTGTGDIAPDTARS